MTVALLLRTRRNDDGLTQAQLAEQIGVSDETIRQVELGSGVVPIPRNKKRIADYLEKRVTDLWPIAETATQESHA